MGKTNQHNIRIDPDLMERFKLRAEAAGYKHTEALRMLIREFAYGRVELRLVSSNTQNENDS